LSAAGGESPLRHLGQDGIAVLRWHGDIFDLPKDARLLASTAISRNQAFSWANNLALQFHPEATAVKLERWFIGHACEIAGTPGVSVPRRRSDSASYARGLELAARRCLDEWLRFVL
jgi:GMP synthase (glutamine-hydrolysing)